MVCIGTKQMAGPSAPSVGGDLRVARIDIATTKEIGLYLSYIVDRKVCLPLSGFFQIGRLTLLKERGIDEFDT